MRMEVRLTFTTSDKELFEKYLVDNDLHYYDLAEHLRVSRAYINQVFSGLRTINLGRLKQIEDWCGIEFEIDEDEREEL